MRRIVVAIEAARQTLDKAYIKLTDQKKHELEETLILHLHVSLPYWLAFVCNDNVLFVMD